MTKTLKIVGTVAVVGALAALAVLNSTDLPMPTFLAVEDTNSVQAFNQYISQYHKSYITKSEYNVRLNNFRGAYNYIQQHDPKKEGYEVGLNQFADWSQEELNKMLALKVPTEDVDEQNQPTEETPENNTLLGAPTSIDWRQQGAVTAVRNQGSCAGCYGFATTATMEGAYKIKTGQLKVFSPQQIIDCTGGWFRNAGCQGGYMTNAYNYLRSYKMMQDSSYPYISQVSSCKYNAAAGVVNTVGYGEAKYNYDALLNAVAKQPVAVGVTASAYSFLYYRGGIITSNCGGYLNHAVTIVGYGQEGSTPYWIVKNSWGANWGEQGYVRILRQPGNNGGGMCGIQQLPSYPKL